MRNFSFSLILTVLLLATPALAQYGSSSIFLEGSLGSSVATMYQGVMASGGSQTLGVGYQSGTWSVAVQFGKYSFKDTKHSSSNGDFSYSNTVDSQGVLLRSNTFNERWGAQVGYMSWKHVEKSYRSAELVPGVITLIEQTPTLKENESAVQIGTYYHFNFNPVVIFVDINYNYGLSNGSQLIDGRLGLRFHF